MGEEKQIIVHIAVQRWMEEHKMIDFLHDIITIVLYLFGFILALFILSVIVFIVLVTSPIWIIPYLICKK